MKEQADAATMLEANSQVQSLKTEIQTSEQQWNIATNTVENELVEARYMQLQRSKDAITAASYMDTTSKLRSLEAQAASQLSVLKQKVSAVEGSSDSLFSELKNLESIIRDLEVKREMRRNMATTMTNLVQKML